MEKELLEHGLNINRRKFISRLSVGLGSAALGSLLIPGLFDGSEILKMPSCAACHILRRKQKE
jgi:hypothetical protein